jgi:DtxR family Mn-dependent transcriptional regulator
VAHHLTPNMEMYLKTIYEIDGDGEPPRVKTIADRLGVTMPSVSGAVETLQRRGLVEHSPYGAVRLTRKGKRVARDVKDRNDLLYRFLLDVLKLPEAIASRDACVLEHVVSPRTLERLSLFLEFTRVCKRGASEVIDHFSDWLECQDQDGDCAGCVEEDTRC